MLSSLRWLLICCPVAAGWAQTWSPEFTVGGVYDDNVTNAVRQEKADRAVALATSVQQVRVLSRDWQGSISGGARTEFWHDYSGLNLSQLSVRGGLRRKFGLGPYATKLDLGFEGFHQIAEVSAWSGNGYRADLALQRRFGPRWSGRLSTELKRLQARRAVYSGTGATVTAAVDYAITPDWRIAAAMRYGEGDQLSWCRESFPEFINQGPQWTDGIFGGDWFPYTREGHHRGINLRVDRTLGARSNLALGYDLSESQAPQKHRFHNHRVSLHFSHAF